MSGYHDRTLELLKESGIQPGLMPLEWNIQHPDTVPAAYAEWVARDPRGEILSRFSNTDNFQWQKVGELSNGRSGFFFHRESQGNFEAVCVLDGSQNPPVEFIWESRQSIQCCPKFSDYVLAQVFDWQHKIVFDNDGYAQDLDYLSISLRSADQIDLLSQYEEFPSSSIITDEGIYVERRFRNNDGARAVVRYSASGHEIYLGGAKCAIEVTASNKGDAFRFEAELLELLSEFVTAPIFHCPHHPKDMLSALDELISGSLKQQIKYFCDTPLEDEMVSRIMQQGLQLPFADRIEEHFRENRTPPPEEWIGGADWGLRMKLIHIEHGWIRVETIEAV